MNHCAKMSACELPSSSAKNPCQNRSPSSGVALKYGDADVCSKRRKDVAGTVSPEGDRTAVSSKDENDSNSDFEQFLGGCGSNSSFYESDTKESLDFKGGLIKAATPTASSTPTKPSANNTTTIDEPSASTAKPPPLLTSKGFENTFRLLQDQVESHGPRASMLFNPIYSSLERLDGGESVDLSELWRSPSDATSAATPDFDVWDKTQVTSVLANFKSRFDADATLAEPKDCDSVRTPILHMLYDFAAKGLPCQDEATVDQRKELCKPNPDFFYHAFKRANGRKCLRVVRSLLLNQVLCGNRVSQMTRAYDDIEAVTRLLEEKEKDLELTVQIGKELLTQNNTLEHRINELESDLKSSNDDRAQLLHELHKKNELIAVLTSDADDALEGDTPTFSKSVTLDLMQKRIASLQDENKSLKMEASQLANETDAVEAHERELMLNVGEQLTAAQTQFDSLSLELERQREENRLQHEQIVSLTARLAEAEMRLHQLTQDNDEHVSLLNITKENQNSLALELVEFKQRYQEVLALLQETQEQLRKQRKRQMPQARSSFMASGPLGGGGGGGNLLGMLQPESLHSELMESSLYSENSLDSGISGDHLRSGRLSMHAAMQGSGYGSDGCGPLPPYKRTFETVRCGAGKTSLYGDSAMSQLGAMSMSSASVPRMSTMSQSGLGGMGVKTLSLESLASQSDDGYPAQVTGIPGAPGAKDLEAALKRLTPAEVLARRAMLSHAPAGSYNYDDPPCGGGGGGGGGMGGLPLGIRTPDSIMSTGSSGGLSSSTNISGSASGGSSASMHHWRLPEKLQIVKPLEGSQTLHHWSRLATPTLSGLLEERPGVTIRGGRGLDDLGMQVYSLSDVEEDASDDLPGKQFETVGCIYTYTTSTVMHPDDGLVNDLSFLSQSQMSSRMASASTSRQPSCPATPHAGLSRKNSCSTFSVNLGLASMLNERGIKAVTPSALNTPAGANFSPTVTPCNSPEGSPTRSMSPEPLFGLLSSGADLIRRKLIGPDFDRPCRSHHKQKQQQQQQQQKQKIILSRLERRALRSLKLVEKVESIGLENIITTQPNAMSQLASGIANRSTSPMAAQLTHLKHLHTSANHAVDDLHFNRDQIKSVLHKGLHSPASAATSEAAPAFGSSSASSAYNSDNDELSLTALPPPQTTTATAAAAATTTATTTKGSAQAATAVAVAATTAHSSAETRAKQMQRQKSRRSLKNGLAVQRPDLGTTGRVRPDLGKVLPPSAAEATAKATTTAAAASAATTTPPEPQQSITQAFVGSVSSLLFGRKGGWL